KVAEDIRLGLSMKIIMSKHNVTMSTVKRAADEAGLPYPKSGRLLLSRSTYDILADLLNTQMTFSEIARKHQRTPGYVRKIVRSASASGVKIPERPDGRTKSRTTG